MTRTMKWTKPTTPTNLNPMPISFGTFGKRLIVYENWRKNLLDECVRYATSRVYAICKSPREYYLSNRARFVLDQSTRYPISPFSHLVDTQGAMLVSRVPQAMKLVPSRDVELLQWFPV